MAEIVPGVAATYTFGSSQHEYYTQVKVKLGWLASLLANSTAQDGSMQVPASGEHLSCLSPPCLLRFPSGQQVVGWLELELVPAVAP